MNKVQVWSCGGGTQSCAIAALIVQGKLPKPDIAVIADTGREVQSTWDYLDSVLRPELSKVGVEVNRISASEFGYEGGTDFIQSGELIIPAFTTENNGVGKLSAFCNRWWKQDCTKRWLSIERGLTRSKYRTWIGYSLDESRRYFRMMGGDEYRGGLLWLPLVELAIRRAEAIRIVELMGWPTPPRSRCWMCPNQGDSEWRELKESHPSEFAKAVAFQSELTSVDPHAWLHKSCKPLDQVDFTQPEDLFSRPCNSGMCFI